MESLVYHSEFSLVLTKSEPLVLNGIVLGTVIGWMTAQELSPVVTGSYFDNSTTISISSNGKVFSTGLYDVFDPKVFASTFDLLLTEDEVSDGDWCIRTRSAQDFIDTGARSVVLVKR